MKLVDSERFANLKASGLLPSPKGLALAIIRLLQDDDYKIDDLVRLIQPDPAITGGLLKLSNAAVFGHSRPNVSLSQAVTILGTSQVRVIVIALSVMNTHRSGNCYQFDYEEFWSRALATAISARALASYAKINSEENFTAGLLCSLGELAMASVYPERYGEIFSISKDSNDKRIALEREAFGNDHRELNATLLLEWGLPKLLVTAIYHCEAPDETVFQEGSRIYGLTLSLNVALALADICVAEEGERIMMLPNLYAKAAKLDISTEEMNSMADSIIASWHEWGKFLNIQTRQIPSIADLSESTTLIDQEPINEFRKTLSELERDGIAPMAASIDVIESLINLENDPDRKNSLIGILKTKKKLA